MIIIFYVIVIVSVIYNIIGHYKALRTGHESPLHSRFFLNGRGTFHAVDLAGILFSLIPSKNIYMDLPQVTLRTLIK